MATKQETDRLSKSRLLTAISYRLARICAGRENHAALVEVRAVRLGRQVEVSWHDAFTGQAGLLAIVNDREAAAVMRTLFTHLRQWRSRCEHQPAARAKAVGA